MTHAFWPGLVLALIALGLWIEAYGWPAYRRWLRNEALRVRGLCPGCELPADRCTCYPDVDIR